MKIGILVVLLIAIVGLSGCFPSDPSAYGTVSGRVKSADGQFLWGAVVRAGEPGWTVTSQKGWFTLHVRPGSQTVRVSLVGYLDDGRGSATVLVFVGQETILTTDLVLVPEKSETAKK